MINYKTYIIDWFEIKPTSAGKMKANATLKDETGALYEGITIWGDFPDFASLAPGRSVMGEIEITQKGVYTNKTLKPALTNTLGRKTPYNSKSSVTEAVKMKAEGIKESQERKNEGIKLAAAARDAVLIVTTFYPELAQMGDVSMREEAIRIKVGAWRKYLTDNFGDDLPFV